MNYFIWHQVNFFPYLLHLGFKLRNQRHNRGIFPERHYNKTLNNFPRGTQLSVTFPVNEHHAPCTEAWFCAWKRFHRSTKPIRACMSRPIKRRKFVLMKAANSECVRSGLLILLDSPVVRPHGPAISPMLFEAVISNTPQLTITFVTKTQLTITFVAKTFLERVKTKWFPSFRVSSRGLNNLLLFLAKRHCDNSQSDGIEPYFSSQSPDDDNV